MDLKEADERWFTFQPIEGVKFALNDSVRVTSGEHKGKLAAVISLLSVAPPRYLVELALGGDIEIAEADLDIYE